MFIINLFYALAIAAVLTFGIIPDKPWDNDLQTVVTVDTVNVAAIDTVICKQLPDTLRW